MQVYSYLSYMYLFKSKVLSSRSYLRCACTTRQFINKVFCHVAKTHPFNFSVVVLVAALSQHRVVMLEAAVCAAAAGAAARPRQVAGPAAVAVAAAAADPGRHLRAHGRVVRLVDSGHATSDASTLHLFKKNKH